MPTITRSTRLRREMRHGFGQQSDMALGAIIAAELGR
jgi:hypothetical protein